MSLLNEDLLNPPKLLSAKISRNYLGMRIGRFKLSIFRRFRGGCSFEWCRGNYFCLDICSRKKHAWWSVMIYFSYNESWRSRCL